ncbi:hypothetical protein DIS24_g7296 [Lasiodiplodia hormozganensis]|uniref:Protein byr4 n=2 Tax=Lasiodiplodia TaxID=66739 RepID=A0A5N5DS66_9PEZI|nr:hypothetical protein DBV05_g1741 [Lasiodiplodia theobromae]KAK0647900.1 hypothetical protein DIS24_g7296 [Lasiodiplodia hormozganensis]
MASLHRGSFRERADQMSPHIENWDDDDDFHGDLFAQSASSHANLSRSSRAPSLRSESAAGEEDWQVLLAPNDEASTKDAISSAKHAGIPIPTTVPSSALLGGTIKRLGKKPSRQKIHQDDDWADDLELPGPSSGTLKLKTLQPPATPSQDDDDFDDWAEGGSLGIRFGGTRRDTRTRGSSVSAAMSPSMGSCMTLESEDDDFGGLLLPKEPIDFNAILRKRQDVETDDEKTPQPEPRPPQEGATEPERQEEHEEAAEAAAPLPDGETAPQSENETLPDPQGEPPAEPEPQSAPHPEPEQPLPPATLKSVPEDDDFFADLDMGSGDILDPAKLTVNRNVKVNSNKPQPTASVRATTTLTFTDKPSVSSTSRIPRPMVPVAPRSRLDPVYEPGAFHQNRHGRIGPTTTSAQLLRAKRSAPVLRSDYKPSSKQPTKPFLPAGVSTRQSQHITAKSSTGQLRRDSDPRALSPTPRTYSRLSRQVETPSRTGNRKDIAPASLVREAATKRMFTKPARKRNFGDGSELDAFDDLPTSVTKESKYVKQPSNRQPSKMIRQVSHSKLPVNPERSQQSPQPPPTPKRTLKRENTPSFARDTASSRIAREERLVASRNPSPQAHRKKGTGQKPYLIKQMNTPAVKNEKGMTYNPVLHRWEGNEAALHRFSSPVQEIKRPRIASHHSYSHSQPQAQISSHQHTRSTPSFPTPAAAPHASSPPRPALISHISSSRGVQIEKGMVFDPRKMCWLKLDPRHTGPLSPAASIGDESDPFADIEDLKDDIDVGAGAGGYFSIQGGPSVAQTPMDTFVSEEFDLGPGFIRRQREEEEVWRRRVEGWVGGRREYLGEDWRWSIRDLSIEMAEHLPR